jgi:hypothetical protein
LQSVNAASKNEQRRNVDCRMAQLVSSAALNRTLPNSQPVKTQPASRDSVRSTSWKVHWS